MNLKKWMDTKKMGGNQKNGTKKELHELKLMASYPR